MARARYAFAWEKQFELALDPERARAYHAQTRPEGCPEDEAEKALRLCGFDVKVACLIVGGLPPEFELLGQPVEFEEGNAHDGKEDGCTDEPDRRQRRARGRRHATGRPSGRHDEGDRALDPTRDRRQ